MERYTKSINWIASLRGVLVLCVYLSHYLLVVDHRMLFVIGKVGVAGFFLISGFLAVNSIEKRSAKLFLINRFFRLYPVYWLLLFGIFLLSLLNFIKPWTLLDFLANMTLFHQYLGFENMIGASWMLSIMIIFFCFVAVGGKSLKLMEIFFVVVNVGAVISSLLRFFCHKPFPTAIFLMAGMGFLGFFYNKKLEKKMSFSPFLVLFEVVLFISSYLSYVDMIAYYLIAYNVAFALFFFFCKFDFDIAFFKLLGALGFTFFLGARIPFALMNSIVQQNENNYYGFLLVHFFICIIFSYFVTKYIEKPILKISKSFGG